MPCGETELLEELDEVEEASWYGGFLDPDSGHVFKRHWKNDKTMHLPSRNIVVQFFDQ